MIRARLYGSIEVAVNDGDIRIIAMDPRNEQLAKAVRDSVAAAEMTVSSSPAVADVDLALAEAIADISGLGPMELIYHVTPAHDPTVIH